MPDSVGDSGWRQGETELRSSRAAPVRYRAVRAFGRPGYEASPTLLHAGILGRVRVFWHVSCPDLSAFTKKLQVIPCARLRQEAGRDRTPGFKPSPRPQNLTLWAATCRGDPGLQNEWGLIPKLECNKKLQAIPCASTGWRLGEKELRVSNRTPDPTTTCHWHTRAEEILGRRWGGWLTAKLVPVLREKLSPPRCALALRLAQSRCVTVAIPRMPRARSLERERAFRREGAENAPLFRPTKARTAR